MIVGWWLVGGWLVVGWWLVGGWCVVVLSCVGVWNTGMFGHPTRNAFALVALQPGTIEEPRQG